MELSFSAVAFASPIPPITIDFEPLAVASGPIATVLSPSAFA